MLFYHLPYPATAVDSLKEVVVSLGSQLLPAKTSLREVQQASDQGFGGIGIVEKEIVDLAHEIRTAMGGEFQGGDHWRFL